MQHRDLELCVALSFFEKMKIYVTTMKKEFHMPFKPILIIFLILFPMVFFYYTVETKQEFIDISAFFLISGLTGALYPLIFHKLGFNTSLILLCGVISSIFVFFISNFMSSDSSGFIKAGAIAFLYLAVFIPCYLISISLQVVVLKYSK